ncbi:MAG: NB-ARC domain-containing protein [Rhodothermales bacterium]
MKRGNLKTQNPAFLADSALSLNSNSLLLPPALPKYYTDRAVSYARLAKVLLPQEGKKQPPTTVLHGAAGTGKSMLAASFFESEAIRNTYPDGVFWIDAGLKPYDLTTKINDLGNTLDKNWIAPQTRDDAIKALKQLLATKTFLLVLDDVNTVQLALQLKSAGPDSHVLITTRNERIAEALRATHVSSERFSPKTSITCLTGFKSLSESTANLLAGKLGHIPHNLTLAGLLVKGGYNIDLLLASLDGITDSQMQSHLIGLHLGEMQPTKRDLTTALGILPVRTPIPLSAVHLLWHKLEQTTGKVNHLELIQELVELDLIRRRSCGSRITINDQLAHIVEDQYEDNIQGWHEALLSAYNRDELPWSELQDDGYLFRFLCYHLAQTAHKEILPALLLSFEWLQSKLSFTDIDALFDDFNIVREDKTLRVVQEALRLSAPILSRDANQLGNQLIGRLQELEIPALRDLVDAIRIAAKPEPVWLDPIKVNLDIPGSSLLQAYKGHGDVIHAIDIDAEGQMAISASSDRTLKLWDIRTGAQLRTFRGHHDLVHTVAFTQNGKFAISGSDDLSLKVWDIEKGTNLRTYALHSDKILSIVPLGDNKRVLSSDESGKLFLWDLWSGEIIKDMESPINRIWSIAVTPENHMAFTAGDDHTIGCVSLKEGSSPLRLTAHDDWIWSLKVTPDGRHLISASEDQSIIVWDLFTGQVARVLSGHQAGVRAIDLSKDGKTLVSASEDQSMIVWDFEQGKILRTFTGHDDWVWDMAITPDGKGVLSASDDSSLKLWSLTGHTYQIEKEAHKKGVRALTISPDNSFLLSASDDTSMMKWRLDTAKVTAVFQGHSDWVWDIAVTSKGRYAVSTSFDCSINVWDLKSETRKYILNGHDDWVWCAALTWNNRFLVSGSEDKTIGIWDMEHGKLIRKLRGHAGGVTAVVISNDNKLVISASLDHTIRVWRIEDGKLLYVLKGHTGPVRALLISQLDQRIISSSDDGTIRIWNFNVGFESGCLSGHTGPIRHLALTPMGYHLVSAGEDKIIRVWDLSMDQVVFELKGHEKDIRQIAVSRDGRHIASTSDDHALFLWDLEEGKRISSFYADHPLTRCIFTIDGHRVVAGDAGGGVHFLRIDDLSFG